MIDYLSDSTGSLVCLVNVRTTRTHLFCGATAFKGGLTGAINVYNGATNYLIDIPESVKTIAGYEVRSSPDDNLVIKIHVKAS
jgi:hypothetical protein